MHFALHSQSIRQKIHKKLKIFLEELQHMLDNIVGASLSEASVYVSLVLFSDDGYDNFLLRGEDLRMNKN